MLKYLFFLFILTFSDVFADDKTGSYGLEIFIRTKNTNGLTITFTAPLLNPNETRWTSGGWLTTATNSSSLVIEGDDESCANGFDLDSTQADSNPKLGIASYIIQATSVNPSKSATFIVITNGWFFTGDKWLVYDYQADAFYLTSSCDMDIIQQISEVEVYNSSSPNSSKLQPTVPSNLSVSNQNNHPKLTWNASQPSLASMYKVYRNNLHVHTTNLGETSWIDEAVRLGGGSNQSFDYKVIALNALNPIKHSDGYSNTATAYGIQFEEIISKPFEKNILFESKIDEAFPNPFNPESKINFSIMSPTSVSIKIYDALGRLLEELVNGYFHAGTHTHIFNGSPYPSGVYYLAFQTNSNLEIKKLVLQK